MEQCWQDTFVKSSLEVSAGDNFQSVSLAVDCRCWVFSGTDLQVSLKI